MAETGDGPPWHRAARPPAAAAAHPGGRGALSVGADRIRPGDWLRDQGELKQVVEIEPVHERLPARAATASGAEPTAYIVRFAVQDGEPPSHLFIPAEVVVSVWRTREAGS
jgi:hypothetical protein